MLTEKKGPVRKKKEHLPSVSIHHNPVLRQEVLALDCQGIIWPVPCLIFANVVVLVMKPVPAHNNIIIRNSHGTILCCVLLAVGPNYYQLHH